MEVQSYYSKTHSMYIITWESVKFAEPQSGSAPKGLKNGWMRLSSMREGSENIKIFFEGGNKFLFVEGAAENGREGPRREPFHGPGRPF